MELTDFKTRFLFKLFLMFAALTDFKTPELKTLKTRI